VKNTVLINTHLGTKSEILLKCLNKNPRIQVFKTGKNYDNMQTLHYLTAYPHKLRNSAAIYLDEINFNSRFSCLAFYKICKFVYLVREAKPSLNLILKTTNFSQKSAMLYYTHRLRRLYEMARRTPNAVFLTLENVVSGKGLPLIEKYLNLKNQLKIGDFELVEAPDVIDFELADRAQKCYEKYFYRFRNIEHLQKIN
jgi:hypothetical protein